MNQAAIYLAKAEFPDIKECLLTWFKQCGDKKNKCEWDCLARKGGSIFKIIGIQFGRKILKDELVLKKNVANCMGR